MTVFKSLKVTVLRLFVGSLLLIVPAAFAQSETNIDDASVYEPEEFGHRGPASSEAGGRVAAGQLNQARYRLYPGGQDEEDLKVQDALPIPTRYPDGSAPPTSSSPRED